MKKMHNIISIFTIIQIFFLYSMYFTVLFVKKTLIVFNIGKKIGSHVETVIDAHRLDVKIFSFLAHPQTSKK